jgi:radical SAM superfamily enzyme YgiQ (UPF0313 family)
MADLIIWNSYDYSNHSAVRPVGPHQLSSWLSQFGYKIKVIDFCSLMTTKQLVDITEKYITSHTVAIGASTTFWNANPTNSEPVWAIRARTFIETTHPKLNWILGGSRTSVEQYKFKWTKFTGHAENELLKFLDERTCRKDVRPIFDIRHLNKHFLDESSIAPSEVLPMELSRGCQFKCTFCRYPLIGKKKNTYIRDYSLVEQEMLYNYERYGTTRYAFMDDTVNESVEKVEALANIASRLPFELEWIGYVRLDLIGSKPHTIDLLRQSGLRSAFFGIESFHPKASHMVNKGWNGSKGKDFLLRLREHWKEETVWQLAFIVGLTGESSQDLDETQQWCIDNNMHSWFWNPLSISKHPDLVWKSEFDLNYENYGYSFPNQNDLNYWENDSWNANTASEKSKQLSDAMQPFNKPGPWLVGEIASLGYQFKDVMLKYKHELNFNEFEAKTKTFVDQYIDLQMKL